MTKLSGSITTSRRKSLGTTLAFLTLLGGLVLSGSAQAQVFPAKPVRVIIPFPPGGATDVTGRAIGDALARKWGQPVVIENRAGAGGTVGSAIAAKAAPDGYTLVLGVTGSHGIAGSLYSSLPYDPLNDFEPVTRAVIFANAIIVNSEVPARSLQELIALAKKDAAYQTYGADGNGTASHLTMELIKSRAGFFTQAVQYKGSTPLLTDLASGVIKVGIMGLPTAEPFIKSGKIRVIAITTDRDYTGKGYRTVAEQGFTGLDAAPWSGFFAPRGTPKPIVEKISKDVAEAMRQEQVRSQFAALGLQPSPLQPEEFRRGLAQEIEKWAAVVRLSGAKVD